MSFTFQTKRHNSEKLEYRYGLNATITNHLSGIVKQIESLVNFEDDDIVVDIGANDATLLSKYCNHINKIAIDPNGEQFNQYYPDNVKLIPKLFNKDVYKQNVGIQKAKVVTSISMFYDSQEFIDDVAEILHKDGIWLMEQSYIPTMINNICHDIVSIADKAGLKVIDMSFNLCSLRVILCHKDSTYYTVNNNRTRLDDLSTIDKQKNALITFLKNGKTIGIYGEENALLQYYGIDSNNISDNKNSDYMLVLPWHFKEEILVRENTYLENGGTFIFPLPYMHIVSHDTRPKALVIGSTGQVGSHMVSLLISKGYNVFTISRNQDEGSSNTTHIPCDITNYELLDCFIKAIKPEEIYNFAIITDNNNPIETMKLNATSVFQILESIKNTNIKFFQIGSIEMFKGSDENIIGINETDIHLLFPITTHAIAEQAAFWAVKNNRELYGTYCVTGICTNVESKIGRESHVTKKVINYFKKGKFDTPLEIGNADMYCDWIYVDDVVNSIYTIMQQKEPSDYIIGSGHVYNIREFIYNVANYIGINCKWINNRLIDIKTNNTIVITGVSEDLNETFSLKTYDNSKLLSIYNIEYNELHKLIEKLM